MFHASESIIIITITNIEYTMSSIYALNVKLSVKSEHRSEFLEIITYDQQQTLEKEPNSIQFVIGEDVASTVTEQEQGSSSSSSSSSSNIFYLHEEYQTKTDFEYHTQTDHYAKWQEFIKTKNPFASPPQVDFYTLWNNDDDSSKTVDKISPRKSLSVNVKFKINPVKRSEFIKIITNDQKCSLEKEPLCIQFEMGENVNESNVFHLHMEFVGSDDGKEGFDAHLATKHFEEWKVFSQGEDAFLEKPVMEKFVTFA